MNALAIDCAVSKLAIAAKKNDNTVKLVYDIGIKQSEKLLSAIDFVMNELSLTSADLNYTTLTLGPGTFTGLRLGLSSLKALSLASGTPIFGIPSLEAYAFPYQNSESVISVLEAKEDEFFFQFFAKGKKLTEPEDKPIDEIVRLLDKESKTLVVGPVARDFIESASNSAPLLMLQSFENENDATDSLFKMVEDRLSAGISPLKDYDGPLYIRKSEAEIVLEEKKAKN